MNQQNQNQQRQPRQVVVPSPEAVTEQQVDTILQVIATLQPFVQQAAPGEFTPASREMDGESKMSAESTFIRACGRLDDILDDKARWGIEGHTKLMDSIIRNHDEQYKFLVAQTAASKSLSRPMFLMKPSLVYLKEDDLFLAYIGDVGSPGCGLVGKGKTPDEAFKDFDAAFTRHEAEQVRVIADVPPPEVSPEVPQTKTKKSPKKK